jgi:thioredoxin-related protein
MNLRLLPIAILVFFSIRGHSQDEANGLVNWMTITEAQEKCKTLYKPMLIDFYTGWCGWCKHMMRTTYSNPGLASYINTHFYPVKFDAEGKDTFEYQGKTYRPLSKEPRVAHEFTVKMLGEKLSYPSTVFVTNNFNYNLLTQGYMDEKKIEPLLIFMVENAWQTIGYDEFSRHFNNTFVDTVFAKAPVKTYPVSELEKLVRKKPRKSIVFIGADFCNTCKVMEKTTFTDTSLAGYLNKTYYVSFFNATSQDTILFKNEKHHQSMVNNFPLHGLSAKLTAGRFSLPALCILDEQLNTIDVLNFYQSADRLKPILAYIGSDAFKSKNFNDFMQEYMKPAGKKAFGKP